MKQYLFFIISILTLFFTACNSSNRSQVIVPTASQETVSPIPTKNPKDVTSGITLEQVAYANRISVLLENYQNIYTIITYKDSSFGKNYKYKSFIEKEKSDYNYCISNSNNYMEVLKNRTIYIKNESEQYIINQFLQDSYEKILFPKIENFFYTYNEKEKVVSYQLDNNAYFITTQLNSSDCSDFLNKYWNLDISSSAISIDYELNTNTLLIQKIKLYFLDKKGKKKELLSIENSANINFTFPDYIEKLENPSQVKKIQLIIDPQTDKEEKVEYVLAKEALFSPFFSEGYQMYKDPECTQIYTDSDMTASDFDTVTYYVTKK